MVFFGMMFTVEKTTAADLKLIGCCRHGYYFNK